MQAQPQREHEWLQQLAGDWSYESECLMGPDQPPSQFSGSESARLLGGLWLIGEGSGEMPGCGAVHTRMTLGFDPRSGRFVGSWIGSMMSHQWIYDGSLDESGKVLTLDTEGPSFAMDGTLAKYQDIIEVVDADHRILRSRVLGADGNWTQFMQGHYRRVAA